MDGNLQIGVEQQINRKHQMNRKHQADIEHRIGIGQIEKKHIDSFRRLQDPGSQCEYLLLLGMEKPPLYSLREDRYRIGGCKTAIWLRADGCEGTVHFACDSDSLLVRGVLSILEELYEGRTPDAIRAHPMGFLDYISDDVIYPEIKENGLSKCHCLLGHVRNKMA